MELVVTSLQQSLSPACRVPTDIKFVFKEENDGASSLKEVRAHKVILALVSDVFEKGFYGDIRDDGCVVIKDASHDSFEAMINFIYNVNSDVSIYDLERLCSLYYLGDKYNINALKIETLLAIIKKDIPAEEILGVCVLMEQHSVHEELKETLQKTTAKSLSKIFEGDLGKAIDFLAQIEIDDSTPISAKSLVLLLAGMKKIKPTMVCGNCKSYPCLTGVGITRENFVPGAKVSGVNGGNPNIDMLLRMDNHDSELFHAVDKLAGGRLNTYTLSPKWYVYNCRS